MLGICFYYNGLPVILTRLYSKNI